MHAPPNTSSAVRERRFEPADSADDFPTPCWATRALLKHVIAPHVAPEQTCLEPSANRGFMVRPLAENFASVTGSDLHDYGCGYAIRNFLAKPYKDNSFDWVITNPPFKQAPAFVQAGYLAAREGVAVLVRTAFLEGVGRYKTLFSQTPPAIVAPFSERVPMLKGRYDPGASTATAYSWMVWLKSHTGPTEIKWIPPCRADLYNQADIYPYRRKP